jgi:outer membrane immunogenic protein
MKKFLLAALGGVVLATGPVLAADLTQPYYKAPPPPTAPVVSWTGCYLDGGVGYGFEKSNHFNETNPGHVVLSPTTSSGGEGWLGRVGGGCDYQFASSFVIGAFADYDFADLHGTALGSLDRFIGEGKENAAWAAGGRVGYLITPSLLSYIDGGYTEARSDAVNLLTNTLPSVATGFSLPSHTYHGWFIGGGYEYALNSIVPISGLFWRTEYRFADYQAADIPVLFNGGAPTASASHTQKDVQTITSGLVWRFNFGGPPATQY